MRVAVERGPLYAGTLVESPDAGGHSALLLIFDLDDDRPQAWRWEQDGGRERVGTEPFFSNNTITLSPDEVEDVIFIGQTSGFLCRWRLEIDVDDGAKLSTITIDDHGEPFKTSGIPSAGFAKTLDWAWYDGQRFQPPPDIEV